MVKLPSKPVVDISLKDSGTDANKENKRTILSECLITTFVCKDNECAFSHAWKIIIFEAFVKNYTEWMLWMVFSKKRLGRVFGLGQTLAARLSMKCLSKEGVRTDTARDPR